MIAEVRTAGLLLLVSAAALLVSFQLPGDVFVDLGPNDVRYVSGFREDFEIDEPTLIHWTKSRSAVRLPFVVRGPYDVTLRFKRHVASPAEVRLILSGEPAPTFVVPQQDFVLKTLRRSGGVGKPLSIELVTSSVDPRPLGIALDWLVVEPLSGPGSLRPTWSALAWLLSWVLLLYAVPRLLGFPRRLAVALAAAALAGLVVLSATHKLWPVHVALTLGLRFHAIAIALCAFFAWRRRSERSVFSEPAARWAVLIVFLGLVVRLFALFHPDFYYPDVRTHSKFVSILWTEGLDGFFSNYIDNQHRHLLGLQYVSGRWVAFPYPPLLYLSIYPLSLLELPVEDWMKLVPATLASVEALVLFALARRLGVSARASALAVTLHATARVVGFRLAVASYAAMFGHFWDLLVVAYLAATVHRIHELRFGLGLTALVAVSLLSYAGSALVLGMLMPAVAIALAARKENPYGWNRGLAVAGWSLAGAAVAVGAFYGQYLPELLGTGTGTGTGEAAGGSLRALVEPRLTPFAAAAMALHRLELFYWAPYCLLFGIGLVLVRREPGLHPLAGPLSLAALATYLGLNVLRAGLGETHIFQFSKDDLVILPLFVVVTGMLVDRLLERGRFGRWAAAALVAGWVGFGYLSFAQDVRGRFIRPDYTAARAPGPQVA